MLCEPRGGGEMGGSTCIMTVLLFNLYNDCIIAHTSTECMLESTSSSDVEENQVGHSSQGEQDLEEEGS